MKKERTKSFEFGKIDFYENGEKRYPVTVEISIGYEDGEMVFSAMADVWKSNRSDIIMGGQCLDDLLPFFAENKLFNEIYRLWKLYHLNDMHAECEHQRELGWEEKAHSEGILCRPCPVCGYEYGTSWLLMPIPEDDKQKILKLFEEE